MFGPPGRGDRIARRLLLPLLAIFLLVTSVFYVFFRHLSVEGDSMQPTLHDGDRVLITRPYQEPAAGDIVIVRAKPSEDRGERELIKRVVAVEGDVVIVERGVAYVNGERENGIHERFTDENDISALELVIPEGHVYILGDNRPVSYDSRFYGPAPVGAISGKVVAVYSPLTRIGRID